MMCLLIFRYTGGHIDTSPTPRTKQPVHTGVDTLPRMFLFVTGVMDNEVGQTRIRPESVAWLPNPTSPGSPLENLIDRARR
jgi:hypothetical protein